MPVTAAHPRRLLVVCGAIIAVALGIVAATTIWVPVRDEIGVAVGPADPRFTGVILWLGVTLVLSGIAVTDPGRGTITFSFAPLALAAVLGGPTAVAWVALIGTTELRELRIGAPWWGILASHGSIVIGWTTGAAFMVALGGPPRQPDPGSLAVLAVGAVIGLGINGLLVGLMVNARLGRPVLRSLPFGWRDAMPLYSADIVFAWLVALVYVAGAWWSAGLIVVVDVASARAMTHHRAAWLLTRNPLTDLPNGTALRDRVRRLRRTTADGMGVLYLDLDGFKAVNDAHGHAAGDEVLRVTGRRLAEACRERDFLAHLHGDEFAVIAPGIATEVEARSLADRLVAAVEPAIDLDGATVRVSATIGIRLVTELADLDAAIRDADRSMNEAKISKWAARGEPRRRPAETGQPAVAVTRIGM